MDTREMKNESETGCEDRRGDEGEQSIRGAGRMDKQEKAAAVYSETLKCTLCAN
jgi:hypothetical protein